MSVNVDDEALSELLGIKAKLETTIRDLTDERELIKRNTAKLKEDREQIYKKTNEGIMRVYKLRIAVAEASKIAQIYGDYIKRTTDASQEIESIINEKMRLPELTQGAMKFKNSMESAISFYSDDNLQMETMKRTNAVREKRVEYTKVESELQDMLRKKEERIRALEREKARQEKEEHKKFIELNEDKCPSTNDSIPVQETAPIDSNEYSFISPEVLIVNEVEPDITFTQIADWCSKPL